MRGFLAALLLVLAFMASPARAEWLRAESPHFIVYGEMSRGRLRDRIVLLERFDAFLRDLTGTTAPPSPHKLKVYLVHGGGELGAVWPVGGGVGGFYKASPDGIFAVVDEFQNWRGNENDTLFHEYAHHFMMQYHPAAYPLWYVEGFADFVMTAEIEPDSVEFGNPNPIRGSWLTGSSSWVPYADILFGDLRRVSVGAFYAQSWLLVHYIMADEGRRAALARYVEALGRGAEPQSAFTAAFDMDAAALDRTMRQYARRFPVHRLDRTQQAPPPITVEGLGSAGINPPLIEAALMLDLPRELSRRVLDLARRAGHDGDPFGERLQARAEILFGDLPTAGPLLDRLLAAAPADAELLYLKGLAHLMAGRRDAHLRATEFRQSQAYFARAFRADPNHYPSLFRYAEALSVDDRFLSENTQNILLLATSLAPQVSEIRLAAAHVLLLRGQFDQAQALLIPLSASVHQPDAGERAAEFLRLARARERPTDTVVFKIAEPATAD